MKFVKKYFNPGQTLVEFALILPLFILIVMFIFDIGRAVFYYSVLYNATREGARYATIQDPGDNSIDDRVVDYAIGMDLETSNVTIGWTDINGNPYVVGQPIFVSVSADYEFRPITPLVSTFLPGNVLPLHVEVSMRLEYD